MNTGLGFSIFLGVFSGFLISLGFPGLGFPNISLGLVIPFAFVPVLYGIRKAKNILSIRDFCFQLFLPVWICGTTLSAFAFYWTTQPAILFGHLPAPIAYAGFAFYCVASGLFIPIMLLPFLVDTLRVSNGHKPIPLVTLALISTLLELVIPRFFLWTLGSLMHSYTGLNQWASLFGFSGMSFFILLSNGLITSALTSTEIKGLAKRLGLVSMMWIVLVIVGQALLNRIDDTLTLANTTRVGYIQPNFTFSELSSNPTRPKDAQEFSLETLISMSERLATSSTDRKIELIVWPESVVPHTFLNSQMQQKRVLDFVVNTGIPILLQAVEFEEKRIEESVFYSTSFMVTKDGIHSTKFRKWIPIPFGETVPFEQYFPWLGTFVRKKVGNSSKIGIGKSFDALPFTDKLKAGALICFDAIFSSLPRLETLNGEADILVNQANFVWMDKSNAGIEFLELARFRAIENARSLILVSNTGPSAAFDPAGRLHAMPTDLMSQSMGFFDLATNRELTVYTRFGNWPLILSVVLALIWSVMQQIKSREKEKKN